MNTVLITAYAVNPFKGSEDGMGWNYILQAAKQHKVIAITRKNNRPHIEKFIEQNPNEIYANIRFEYFDWPKWMLFWKKGPILSLIYYYFWQISLALHILRKNWEFDIVHNLNFHNDWTPTFLWLTGKPLVWGPVGHHPKINTENLNFYGRKAKVMDSFLWILKNAFWKLDPFLFITKNKAAHILCMNTDAAKVLNLHNKNFSICPSVASRDVSIYISEKNQFTILSVGRFVPLKGFDITILAFSYFYHSLSKQDQAQVSLHLVGSGPYENDLKILAANLQVSEAIIWTNWITHHEIQNVYARSSAFLFPSSEGAGMVVAEAMSYSLPVICYDNSGPGQFVHPETQLKVSTEINRQEAIDLFSDKIKLLYFNRDVLSNESHLARKRFDDLFNWELKSDVLNGVYNKVNAQNKQPMADNFILSQF